MKELLATIFMINQFTKAQFLGLCKKNRCINLSLGSFRTKNLLKKDPYLNIGSGLWAK